MLVVSALVCAAACGPSSSSDAPEWRPDDHQAPSAGPEAGGPEAGAAQAEPSPEVMASLSAALFAERCASCHGAEGRGDGEAAPIAMPDMTAAAFHAGRADADLARVIRMGQGLMPGFGEQLNERGIAALVAHVRTLRAP